MKKYLFLLFTLSLFTGITFAQAIGEWKIHMAYHDATLTVPAGNLIYVLSDGSIYSYDSEDTSVQTYDKTNLLYDTDISHIAYNNIYKSLIVVYKNFNIDLIIDDKDTYNIPDYMNKSMTEEKTVNDISINNEYAYLSTKFGIVIVNLKKKEISNTYNLKKNVFSSILINDIIYAATSEGIFTGKLTDNLLDSSNWKLFNPSICNKLVYYNNSILSNIQNDGIYKFNNSTNEFNKLLQGSYTFINAYEQKLIAGNSNTITIFDNTLNSNITINQDENYNHLSFSDNTYWGSNGAKGLIGYKYNKDKNKLERVIESIIPDSPKRNLDYSLTYTDRLLIAGGGIWADRLWYPGVIMELKDNSNWNYFEEGEDITKLTGLRYGDITKIKQDPKDPDHIFATSAGEGLYEFKNKKFIKLYSLDNSTLESAVSNNKNYIKMNALEYDRNNNLWTINNEVINNINILKNDGKWINLYYQNFTKIHSPKDIMFDKNGNTWIVVSRVQQGIFCLNTNNTLEDTKDDQTIFRSTFTNQDGKIIDPLYYFCIAEDKNGTIWIGTDKGPIIINNPAKIFDEHFYCTQIKVPRNDGTNLADLLLENESIKTICIDGANRKWIGTEKSGVYLISEDGLETIHHFTTENSSLISNNIQSIAINPNNGEVWMGTDKGLVSYMSDATEAKESFSKDNVHAFPNPVKPDYEGSITVTGLVYDSDVKITDTNGSLIYSGKSLGGQFTWNGKNRNGKRVASGVYFVLATNTEGKEGIATKIIMIK